MMVTAEGSQLVMVRITPRYRSPYDLSLVSSA